MRFLHLAVQYNERRPAESFQFPDLYCKPLKDSKSKIKTLYLLHLKQCLLKVFFNFSYYV